VDNDQHNSRHDEKGLSQRLKKTAAGLPVERPPSVKEANNTASTHHLAHNLSAKGTVEGDNGVLVLGENGRFDTDQSDHSREAEEERAGNREDEECDEPRDQAHPLRTAFNGFLLQLVETQKHGYTAGEVEADVRHGGLHRSREGKRLPVGLGGDALP
jgi:hypothetical protein